jgi:hypothetical protein
VWTSHSHHLLRGAFWFTAKSDDVELRRGACRFSSQTPLKLALLLSSRGQIADFRIARIIRRSRRRPQLMNPIGIPDSSPWLEQPPGIKPLQ